MNLSVTNLFFELALIFLPGFIWMKIHQSYGAKGEITQFDLILNAFIFGIISYFLLGIIYKVTGSTLRVFSIDTADTRLLQPRILREIFYAAIIAFVGSIIHLYIENYKIFTIFVQTIRATKTYGDEDVWDFIFNSANPSAQLIHLRDFEQRVVYSGIVDVFSESGQLRELLLRDVEVFDFEGTLMYELPRLYLARERENIHIEFPR